ncbi:hypothetical protein [Bradyrhizobium icense]|uniref:Microcystin-dependent protein n=1 Tax=Bradyrhizobium icense TaxID=1274631 RepID=A0A1B1UD43_9BRAD|nr:hypothetical protein [Bradyrhizobium icense]ANW00689.1 hypothetical protein LMTR13_11420 [Bradyrhizobium icense]
MLKKLLIGLAILAGLAGPVQGAGSISLSLSQQFDSLGNPLNGGLLYTYAAGTTTPQSAYQDSALTIPYPNPITLDSAGRVPQLFFADGSIKVRLTNSAGVVQLAADGILVIGASSGGGGGSPVDATTILATGDLKVRYGTGALTGFVRANGRTIGSATSGATERANADTQSLFEYLWGEDSNLTVSGGRGASANADWVANKTIALPDWRGRTIAGLDDMGNTAAGVLTSSGAGFGAQGGTPTILGQAGGSQSHSLTTVHLPPYTPSGSIANGAISISGGFGVLSNGNVPGGGGSAGTVANLTASQAASTFTGTAQGGTSAPYPIVSPTRVATIYIKL